MLQGSQGVTGKEARRPPASTLPSHLTGSVGSYSAGIWGESWTWNPNRHPIVYHRC